MTDETSILGQPYATQLSTQSYGSKPRIEGVQIVDLPLFSDEGGDFAEIVRMAPDGMLEALPGFRPAQISYSYLEPGTIKAWHLHLRQEDLWFVPPRDRLLVGLLDARWGSATFETRMRLVLGAGRARLLLIPRGVAHGAANLSGVGVHLIYLTTNTFNPDDPDERRLPYDLLGADFWQNRPG
ncbi:MAG TPA: dTDP-4-dehydrorhamnose 3,5-epimerase family protein [Chloroflexota bacterium]|nr:dTDP-4-dehydrorhamnose 3,5-epimerase family protein [Chloroflexota bacterium]